MVCDLFVFVILNYGYPQVWIWRSVKKQEDLHLSQQQLPDIVNRRLQCYQEDVDAFDAEAEGPTLRGASQEDQARPLDSVYDQLLVNNKCSRSRSDIPKMWWLFNSLKGWAHLFCNYYRIGTRHVNCTGICKVCSFDKRYVRLWDQSNTLQFEALSHVCWVQLSDQTTQPEAACNTTLREAGDDAESNPAERTCLAPATGLLGKAGHKTAAAVKKVCLRVQI